MMMMMMMMMMIIITTTIIVITLFIQRSYPKLMALYNIRKGIKKIYNNLHITSVSEIKI